MPVLELENLAAGKLGLFTAEDAGALGVSSSVLSYHHRGGRWLRVHPGVYRLAQHPPDPHAPFLAALMWAGPSAVLSHRAAARVTGLDGIRGVVPELWAKGRRTRSGVIVHDGVVPAEEVATTGLLRHTTIERTVADLATVLDDDTLELVVESALRKQARIIAGSRRGSLRLARVLARRPEGCAPTDSELESRYLQVIRLVNIPPPVRQYPVHDDAGRCIFRLDVCWPEAGLWVELDGRSWHDRPEALLHDRRRQNDLTVRLQWLPLRFTWDDVFRRPTATARQTERAYRSRLRR